jgi:hypothetical protein
MKTNTAPQFLVKYSRAKFHENSLGTSQELFQAYRQMDGRADRTSQAHWKAENEPKKKVHL